MTTSTSVRARFEPPNAATRQAIEIAQRGRILLDLATAELAAAERRFGPFGEKTWECRRTLAEARSAWDRLLAEYGGMALEAALGRPPVAVLTFGGSCQGKNGLPQAVLLVIAGKTYRARKLPPAPMAPAIWRLDRIPPEDPSKLADDPFALDPYHAVRMADGSTRCDCADWIFKIDGVEGHPTGLCKHLTALRSLGWV
jgi:hypothetical protein